MISYESLSEAAKKYALMPAEDLKKIIAGEITYPANQTRTEKKKFLEILPELNELYYAIYMFDFEGPEWLNGRNLLAVHYPGIEFLDVNDPMPYEMTLPIEQSTPKKKEFGREILEFSFSSILSTHPSHKASPTSPTYEWVNETIEIFLEETDEMQN
jgi:hypothetical protein